jgi:hypothetical protein
MAYDLTTVLDAPFIQTELITLSCGSASASADIPDDAGELVLTNPGKQQVWISFGGKRAPLTATIGVGQKLSNGRLVVKNLSGIAKVAAIAEGGRTANAKYEVYVEIGASAAETFPSDPDKTGKKALS